MSVGIESCGVQSLDNGNEALGFELNRDTLIVRNCVFLCINRYIEESLRTVIQERRVRVTCNVLRTIKKMPSC